MHCTGMAGAFTVVPLTTPLPMVPTKNLGNNSSSADIWRGWTDAEMEQFKGEGLMTNQALACVDGKNYIMGGRKNEATGVRGLLLFLGLPEFMSTNGHHWPLYTAEETMCVS